MRDMVMGERSACLESSLLLIKRDSRISFNLFLAIARSYIWFFSKLVVASLIDFQSEVTQIMKAVGFAFDDFDLVVDPFQDTGMDGIITVV